MNNIIKNFIEKYRHKQKFRRRFYSIFAVLALFVAVGVIWQMKEPGDAMSGKYICGMEEHTHGENCYEKILICGKEETEDQIIPGHIHTEKCYEIHEICTCEKEEHTHGDECYDAEGNLICEKEEHTHTDQCFTEDQELICKEEETEDQVVPGHTHTDACYEEKLICEKTEHVHTEDCIEKAEEEQTEKKEFAIPQSPDSSAEAHKIGEKAALKSAGKNLRAGENGTDFTQYITDVTVSKEINGSWIPSTEFEVGDSVKIDIAYKLDAGVVTSDNRTIYYQIPKGITLNEGSSGNVTGEDQKYVGTYVITEDGLIQITFYESFADGQAFEGTIRFAGIIASGDSGDDYEINFGGDGTTITVKPDSDAEELGIEKGGYYDSDVGGMVYGIRITSERGTTGEITVTDQFMEVVGADISYMDNTMAITKIKADGRKENISLSSVNIQTYIQPNGLPAFQITGLPKLSAGEKYEIIYNVQGSNKKGENGYIYLDNTATAKTDTNEVSANFHITLSKAFVEKTGVYDYETGKIKWTITINPDKQNISGWQLTDTITLPDGNTMEIKGPVEISDGKSTSSIELPYTFPENSSDTYTITYETDVSGIDIGETATVKNRVDIGEFGDEATVEIIGQGYQLVKEAVNENGPEVDADNPSVGKIKWVARITVPDDANISAEQFTYTDQLYNMTLDGQALEESHLTALWVLAEDLQTIKIAEGGELYYSVDYDICYTDGTVIDPKTDSNKSLTGFQIKFKDHVVDRLKGKTLEIRYKTLVYNLSEYGEYSVENVGRIPGHEAPASIKWTVGQEFDKQASASPLDEEDHNSTSFTNDNVEINFEKTKGIIHYRLLIRPDSTGGDITVTDILPKGASLVNESVKLVNHQSNYWYTESSYDGSYVAQENIQTTVSENDDGTTTVTFVIKDGYQAMPYKWLAIYYDISVLNDEIWTSDQTEKTYINNASWNGKTDETTTKVVKNDSELSKTGEQLPQYDDEGNPLTDSDGKILLSNTIRYYVVINPDGKDLNPDSEYLEMKDTLTVSANIGAEFNVSSVALYQYDAQAQDKHYCGNEINSGQYSFTYDSDNYEITFKLPDKTACVLVYDYIIDRDNAAGNVNILNKASLTGSSSGSTEDSIVMEEVTSGASANKATITLYKVDSTNYDILLSGAEFMLERYEQQADTSYKWTNASLTGLGPDGEFIVGDSGKIVLNFLTETDEGSRYNTLYRIYESKAPDGYEKTDRIYYFVWMEANETKESTIEKMRDQNIFGSGEGQVDPDQVTFIGYSQSETIYVPNVPTELTVQKQWMDKEGTPLEETDLPENITIQLYRHTEGTDVQEAELVEEVILNAEKNWKYTWSGLEQQNADGIPYLYTVKEAGTQGYTVTYSPNNESGTGTGLITVTNTKEEIYFLPETGGIGTLPIYICGVGLVGTGIFYGLRSGIRRRRK